MFHPVIHHSAAAAAYHGTAVVHGVNHEHISSSLHHSIGAANHAHHSIGALNHAHVASNVHNSVATGLEQHAHHSIQAFNHQTISTAPQAQCQVNWDVNHVSGGANQGNLGIGCNTKNGNEWNIGVHGQSGANKSVGINGSYNFY
jgi:hypothetical protein